MMNGAYIAALISTMPGKACRRTAIKAVIPMVMLVAITRAWSSTPAKVGHSGPRTSMPSTMAASISRKCRVNRQGGVVRDVFTSKLQFLVGRWLRWDGRRTAGGGSGRPGGRTLPANPPAQPGGDPASAEATRSGIVLHLG